ncbi:MAG: hypothetical protein HXY21_13210 [Parvularculaceae bacterium]|nr:hypothetical protein [Parvularculaceae bacterium]
MQRLAGALDALESRLDMQRADLAAKSETIEQARLRARTAKTQATAAAEDLADAVRDLRTLIAPKKES